MFKILVVVLLFLILVQVSSPPAQTTVLEAPTLQQNVTKTDDNITKVIFHPAGDKEMTIGIVEKVVEQRDGPDTVYFTDGNQTSGCYGERFEDKFKPGLKHKISVYTKASDCGGRHIVGVEVVN